MLRKSVETRDWLNTIEPRNVRAVMKRVVEDITAIDSLVIIWEFLSTVVRGGGGIPLTYPCFGMIYCFDDNNSF